MLVFYCYFLAEGYGSAVMFMMLQSVPAYKEQLVYYYGVSILLNMKKIAVQAVFYFLYGVVPLFNNYKKKRHAWQKFVAWLKLFPFATSTPPFTN